MSMTDLVPRFAPFRRAFDNAANPRDAANALMLQPGVHVQKWDGDLDALAALTGTNTIYYRSGTNTWSPVVMGGNMTFSGGVLNSTGGGGGGIPEAPTDSKLYGRINATWADIGATYATTASVNTGLAGKQPLDAELTALAGLTSGADSLPYFTGSGTAGLASFTAVGRGIVSQATYPAVLSLIGGQPLDGDLTSIAGFGGTNQWLYRSAADTWSAVTIGGGLSFSGGTLAATGGGGDVFAAGTNTFTGQNYFNLGSNLPLVVGHTARITTTYSMELNGTSAGGTTQHGICNTRWSADTVGAQLMLRKSRGAAAGTNTVVSSGDTLGKVSFAGNTGSGWQSGGPAVSGVCNSAPFGTNTPGYVLVEAVTIGGAVATAATFKDTGCALLGTNTNDSAAAGFVGECLESVISSGSAVAITGSTYTNLTTLALTAGDWEVSAAIQYSVSGATSQTSAFVYISDTSATGSSTNPLLFDKMVFPALALDVSLRAGPARISLSGSATRYLVYWISLGGGSGTIYGGIHARRVR